MESEKLYTPLEGEPKLNLAEFDAFTFRLKRIEEMIEYKFDTNRTLADLIHLQTVDELRFWIIVAWIANTVTLVVAALLF